MARSEFPQFAIPMVMAFFAVGTPTVMLVGAAPHPDVWGAWAGLLAVIVIVLCIVVAAVFIDGPLNVIILALCWVTMYVPWVMALSGFPSSPYVTMWVSSNESIAGSGFLLLLPYAMLVTWAFRKWTGSLHIHRDLLLSLTCILLGLGCTV